MKLSIVLLACLLAFVLLAGCATSAENKTVQMNQDKKAVEQAYAL